MDFKFYEATDVGKVRAVNEDCGVVFHANACMVADGMGGHAAGEVASRTLVETVRACLNEMTGPLDEEKMEEFVRAGNRKILAMAAEHPEYKGMGTTATLLCNIDEKALWVHVGDSRLYLYRDGTLCQVTKDHSYVESLVENGTITEAEARKHPRKNLLLRAVGVYEEVDIDAGSFDLRKDDILLLCTDGLTNMVSDEEIKEVLQMAENPAEILKERALAAGGTDNVTVIVAVCNG